jgi:hypothetical protein
VKALARECVLFATAWRCPGYSGPSAAAAANVFAAYQAQADAGISRAAFVPAMAEAGFKKAKRGGRVVYSGVTFRQALRLAAGG